MSNVYLCEKRVRPHLNVGYENVFKREIMHAYANNELLDG